MSEPGWFTHVKHDQEYFAELYRSGMPWGSIPIGSTTYQTKIYYGARLSSPTSTSWYMSPEISIKTGYKNRCTVMIITELMPSSQQPASGTLGVGFVFFKEGVMLSDEAGGNVFGFSASYTDVTTTVKGMTFLKFELDGKKATIKADNTVSFTVNLSDVPTEFKVAVKVTSVTAGVASVGVYDVNVEYYDQLAYMLSTVTNMMLVFMPIMIIVPLFSKMGGLFKFKPAKKEQAPKTEEAKEEAGGGEKK